MALTTAEGEVIIVLLIMAVFFLAGLYYLRRRFAERTLQLKGEIANSEARMEERAHNQIVLDEAELATLGREGFELDRPAGSLRDARGAFDRRDFPHALQIAQSVHDSLVTLRRSGTLAAARAAPEIGTPGAGLGSHHGRLDTFLPQGEDADATSAPTGASRTAIPRNRMESRFQLSLLTEELVNAVRAHPGDPRVAEANRLAAEANAFEQRSEYTDALRMALRARRTLGGKVETLPPGLGWTVGAAVPSLERSRVDPVPEGTLDGRAPTGARAAPGFGECAQCHRSIRPGDAFCRACGTPVAPTRCPRCQAVMEPDDRFCPRCGSPTP